jgi:threonine dehydratase
MEKSFGLTDIRAAAERLRGKIVRTPLLSSPRLSKELGCNLFVKAESLQRTGAFKYRGALNKMLLLDEGARRRGVVAYSSGNHGHAVAAAASAVGSTAVIVLPSTAPKIKVENCRWWNAEVVFYDPQREDRAEVGRTLIEERGMTLVPPFDDYEIMAGQGTCGVEICEQLNDMSVVPDAVLMNCSGGGLSSGVAEAMKAVFPAIQLCVVEPMGYNKMARALASGVPEKNPPAPKSILEGILGPVVGERTLKVLRRYDVKAKTISEDDALQAMAIGFRDLKLVIEAGGAAGLAAVLTNRAEFKDQNVVVIASGGNVDQEIFALALKRLNA